MEVKDIQKIILLLADHNSFTNLTATCKSLFYWRNDKSTWITRIGYLYPILNDNIPYTLKGFVCNKIIWDKIIENRPFILNRRFQGSCWRIYLIKIYNSYYDGWKYGGYYFTNLARNYNLGSRPVKLLVYFEYILYYFINYYARSRTDKLTLYSEYTK